MAAVAPTATAITQPYTYQNPSTMATRSLIDQHPLSENISSSTPGLPSAQEHATLPSNNYQQAIATANQPTDNTTGFMPSQDNQQSWKMKDLKRGQMEQMVSVPPKHEGLGYTSTSQQK